MQDRASELRRIYLPRTWVNKAASYILAFAGCPVLTEVASTPQMRRLYLLYTRRILH
jgi:hypothetical protein